MMDKSSLDVSALLHELTRLITFLGERIHDPDAELGQRVVLAACE